MKLLACFHSNHVTRREQKEMIVFYFQHPLFLKAKRGVSFFTILKHMHFYTPFLLCMKIRSRRLYSFLGRTIYRKLYFKKRG